MSSDDSDSDSDVEMSKDEADESPEMELDDPEELEEKIEATRKHLTNNPYDVASHEQFCLLLRKNGNLEELTEARKAWNEIAPLPAAEWIRWVKDQQSVDADNETITGLFHEAFKDFQYPDLWLEYVQWACGLGPEHAKKVFEEAIDSIGLRYDKGPLLWEAYLDLLTILFDADSGETKEKAKKDLCSLYKRAFNIPNWNISPLFQRWNEFAEKNNVELSFRTEIEQICSQTQKKLEEFKKWEKQLEESSNSIEVFSQYLEFEKETGDISRAKSFFERIVESHADCENLWYSYGQWAESTLKIPRETRRIYERAVRNCYYSCGLWQKTLLAVENVQGNPDEINQLWTKAKDCISNADDCRALYTTYVYLLRRQADEISISNSCASDYKLAGDIYAEGQKVLQDTWPHEWDPNFTFRKNYAWFAFTKLKDYKLGHRIWEDILASGGGRIAEKWLAAIRDELQFGTDPSVPRKMFYRALNSVSDHPQQIFEAFIQFEREEGTLQQLQTALDKVNAQVLQRSNRPQKKERDEGKNSSQNDKRKNRVAGTPEKRKPTTDVFPERASSAKKLRVEPPIETKAVGSVSPVVKDNDGFVVPGLPIRSPASSPTPDTRTSFTSHNSSTAGPSSGDKTKFVVFVSNLDFKCPESAIEEALNPGVVKIDLRYRGMSKLNMGYGSVTMDSREHYEAALSKDRVLINGRPLYISEHKKPEGNDEKTLSNAFKYSTSLEKNKLFVKNVHFDATNEQLKEIFSNFGKVRDARIVVQKSGKSKGIAYVDMENEEAATKAINAKDLVLLERKLEVFLSNPPKKSTNDLTPLSRKGHASMLQLIPRTARLGNTSNAVKKPTLPVKTSGNPMSNDQFRQLLSK